MVSKNIPENKTPMSKPSEEKNLRQDISKMDETIDLMTAALIDASNFDENIADNQDDGEVPSEGLVQYAALDDSDTQSDVSPDLQSPEELNIVEGLDSEFSDDGLKNVDQPTSTLSGSQSINSMQFLDDPNVHDDSSDSVSVRLNQTRQDMDSLLSVEMEAQPVGVDVNATQNNKHDVIRALQKSDDKDQHSEEPRDNPIDPEPVDPEPSQGNVIKLVISFGQSLSVGGGNSELDNDALSTDPIYADNALMLDYDDPSLVTSDHGAIGPNGGVFESESVSGFTALRTYRTESHAPAMINRILSEYEEAGQDLPTLLSISSGRSGQPIAALSDPDGEPYQNLIGQIQKAVEIAEANGDTIDTDIIFTWKQGGGDSNANHTDYAQDIADMMDQFTNDVNQILEEPSNTLFFNDISGRKGSAWGNLDYVLNSENSFLGNEKQAEIYNADSVVDFGDYYAGPHKGNAGYFVQGDALGLSIADVMLERTTEDDIILMNGATVQNGNEIVVSFSGLKGDLVVDTDSESFILDGNEIDLGFFAYADKGVYTGSHAAELSVINAVVTGDNEVTLTMDQDVGDKFYLGIGGGSGDVEVYGTPLRDSVVNEINNYTDNADIQALSDAYGGLKSFVPYHYIGVDSSGMVESPYEIAGAENPVGFLDSDDENGGEGEADEGIVIHVTNTDELTEALENATGGETILLAGGEYGSWTFSDTLTHDYSEAVTIKSADTNNPAEFKNMVLSNTHNLTLDGLHFDLNQNHEGLMENGSSQLLRADNTVNLTVKNSHFTGGLINDGSEHDGFYTGFGLKGSNFENLIFENNELINLSKGLSLNDLNNSLIDHNYIHDVRSDGIYIKNMVDTKITNNVIDHLTPWAQPGGTGDHGDLIQIIGTTQNIEILNNYLNSGGHDTQGIFITNPDGEFDPDDLVLIENNIVITGMYNGIFVSDHANYDIVNNILLDIGDNTKVPSLIIRGDVSNIHVEDNILHKIALETFGNADLSNNINLSNPDDPSYADLFTNVEGSLDVNFDDLMILVGALDAYSTTPGADYTTFQQLVDWGLYTQEEFDQVLSDGELPAEVNQDPVDEVEVQTPDSAYTAFGLPDGELPSGLTLGKEMQKEGIKWGDFKDQITENVLITKYTDVYSMDELSTVAQYSDDHVGTVHTVSSESELMDVLNSLLEDASGPQTILIEGGLYKDVEIDKFTFSDEVILKSADPYNPAVFDSLLIKKSSDITLDSVRVEVHKFEDATIKHNLSVEQSSNITIKNSEIQGSDDQVDLNNGTGISISSSDNVTIEKNDIHDVKNALGMAYSQNLTVTDNHIHHFIKDAVGIKSIDGLDFSNNVLHSLTTYVQFFDETTGILYTGYERPTEDAKVWDYGHSDYIQFNVDHRSIGDDSTAPNLTKNVTIADNQFLWGDNVKGAQVIYNGWLGHEKNIEAIQNHPLADEGDTWQQNINIIDNYIETSADKAIYMVGVDGGEITGNQVVYIDDGERTSNPNIFVNPDTTFNIANENNLYPSQKEVTDLESGEAQLVDGNYLYDQSANASLNLVDVNDLMIPSDDVPYNVDAFLDLQSSFGFDIVDGGENEDDNVEVLWSGGALVDEGHAYGDDGVSLDDIGNVLQGTSGADTFTITDLNENNVIQDFDLADGDVLDISELLQAYDPVNDAISDFVQVEYIDDNTTRIMIDMDGGANSFAAAAEINHNSDMGALQNMVNDGTLIV